MSHRHSVFHLVSSGRQSFQTAPVHNVVRPFYITIFLICLLVKQVSTVLFVLSFTWQAMNVQLLYSCVESYAHTHTHTHTCSSCQWLVVLGTDFFKSFLHILFKYDQFICLMVRFLLFFFGLAYFDVSGHHSVARVALCFLTATTQCS